jgi:hypothetical protein
VLLSGVRDESCVVLVSAPADGRGVVIGNVIGTEYNEGPKRDTFLIVVGHFEGDD